MSMSETIKTPAELGVKARYTTVIETEQCPTIDNIEYAIHCATEAGATVNATIYIDYMQNASVWRIVINWEE